jgi:hypothetical protein
MDWYDLPPEERRRLNKAAAKRFRQKRKEAGLTEFRVWLRSEDVVRARHCLSDYIEQAEQQLHLYED